MATKSELQAEAEDLGLEFTSKTTKAELSALVAAAAPVERPDPNRRCPVCNRVYDHVHA